MALLVKTQDWRLPQAVPCLILIPPPRPLLFFFTLLSGPHSHLRWRVWEYIFSEQTAERHVQSLSHDLGTLHSPAGNS